MSLIVRNSRLAAVFAFILIGAGLAGCGGGG
jgi:hypothetical protein